MATATEAKNASTAAVDCCGSLCMDAITTVEAQATATLFKALSDPHRVRIVNLLSTSRDPVCVCDITDSIGLSQPTTSFHLKKLTSAGLIDREQRGTWAYYSINPKALAQLSSVVDIRGRKTHE